MTADLAGLDSYQQPTQAQAQALWAGGFRWYGFNIGGASAADTWAVGTVVMLRNLGFELLPIWVPALSMTGDPVADATTAMARAYGTYGCRGVLAVDTEHQEIGLAGLRPYLDSFEQTVNAAGWRLDVYDGAGYVPAGAHAWVPSWVTRPPTGVPTGDAQQWEGGHADSGVDVDASLADPNFPLDGPNTTTIAPPVAPTVTTTTSAVTAATTTEEPVLAIMFSEMSIHNDGTVTSEVFLAYDTTCWYVGPTELADVTYAWANFAVPPVTFKVIPPPAPGYRHRVTPIFVGPDPLATANPPQ